MTAAGAYSDEAAGQERQRDDSVFERRDVPSRSYRIWRRPEQPEPERAQSVFERPRPDYDPLGIRAGGFLIYPQVELGEAYNDNIFA
ncbi:MAG: outer membrane beta-barrel protein, partial [Rhodospirillales bacterium]|nr:outer membrane beta-barrel protein [Rhodospirillales bacterium]